MPNTQPNQQHSTIGPLQALKYLSDGLQICTSKECRLYVIIPVLVNLILMSAGGYCLYLYIESFLATFFDWLPGFLYFLSYLISTFLVVMIVFIACYFFSTIATIIASPFYGLLADRVEMMLNGTKSEDLGLMGAFKDIPRIMMRELRKQLFFIPRAILCLIITFVPILDFFCPVFWFALTAWMGCLQYCDYAYDNHKIPFNTMRADLRVNAWGTFSFGAVVGLGLTVPLLNLILPSAAVCAGTKYYLQARGQLHNNTPKIEEQSC